MAPALRNILSQVDTFLTRFWTAIMVLSITIMTIGALAQVIMRTIWGASWAPSTEIIAYCFTFATFAGAALLFRGRHHLAIDFFVDRLPGGSRQVAAWISDAVVLATCLWLAYLSIGMIRSGGNQFSPTMGFTLGWIYTIVPLSLLSCSFFVIVHGFRADPAGHDPGGAKPIRDRPDPSTA